VVRRLSRIASAARPSAEAVAVAPAAEPSAQPVGSSANLSSARAIAQAAQAFSERRRSNGLAA
jgi:hypothetical protein